MRRWNVIIWGWDGKFCNGNPSKTYNDQYEWKNLLSVSFIFIMQTLVLERRNLIIGWRGKFYSGDHNEMNDDQCKCKKKFCRSFSFLIFVTYMLLLILWHNKMSHIYYIFCYIFLLHIFIIRYFIMEISMGRIMINIDANNLWSCEYKILKYM